MHHGLFYSQQQQHDVKSQTKSKENIICPKYISIFFPFFLFQRRTHTAELEKRIPACVTLACPACELQLRWRGRRMIGGGEQLRHV